VSARTTALVVEREVREAGRKKSIWALVGFVLLASTGMVLAPELIPDDDRGTVVIVGDDVYGVADALGDVPDRDIEVDVATDRDAASAIVEAGDADLAIVLDRPPTLLVDDERSSLVTIVREVVAGRVAAARLTEVGIAPTEVSDAFAAATPSVEPVDVEREGREGAAFALTIVLYLLTVMLTSQVAGAVAVEKSNRVSEVLLAIVPPRSMLVGKVIGVGAIGLVTLAAGAAPVVVRFLVGGGLPDQLGRSIALSTLWFVGGLALYLTIAAAMGSLVSRQEEVGAVIAPITTLLVLGYIASITASDSIVGTVLAYVPLTSPMVEPHRIAVGTSSPVEQVGSLVVLAASVAVVARVATVVFRRGIVGTGRRLSLRDVLRPGSRR
jgi:ABC-2 type transport system permease protein